MTKLKTRKVLTLSILMSSLAFTADFALASEKDRCEEDTSAQPGKRVYEYSDGWIIYEGSLFRNLTDLSRLIGVKGIQPQLGHDIHLMKRFITNGKSPKDVVKAINAEIDGAFIELKDDLFWIKAASAASHSNNELRSGCQTFTFRVNEGMFIDAISDFANETGWVIETDLLSPLDKRLKIKSRTITGGSYFDIFAQLVANTGLGVQIEY